MNIKKWLVAMVVLVPAIASAQSFTAPLLSDISFNYRADASSAHLINFTIVFNNGALCDGATYTIEYGDGATSVVNPPCTNDTTATLTTSHAYAKAGPYTAILKRFGQNFDTLSLTVTDSTQGTPATPGNSPTVFEGSVGGTTSGSCPNITTNLKVGDTDASTNGQVTVLQKFLTSHFQLDGSLVVGTFGPQTENYVKQFQAQSGIEAVGNVGVLTRSAIAASCSRLSSGNPQTPAPSTSNTQTPATSQGNGASSSCVLLAHSISQGATDATTGGDVTKLQNFLIAQGSMQGSATGFFGPKTQTAVQAYQKSKGIVSAGTPDTTGYGAVGTRTRAVMAVGCQTTATTDTPTPSNAAFSASPASGPAQLSVTFTATMLTPNVAYTVDNGDGTAATVLSPNSSTCVGTTPSCTMTGTHVYNSGGIFTAKLQKPGTSVTCTDVSYNVNDPLSYLNMGTSPNCTNGNGTTVINQTSVQVTGVGQPTLTARVRNSSNDPGTTDITAKVGDTIDYTWHSANGTAWSATISDNGLMPVTWVNTDGSKVATTANGTAVGIVDPVQAGHSYTIVYTVTDTNGHSGTATLHVTISK